MGPEGTKPVPTVETSAKFASWSLKELSQTMSVMQKMLDQKLSEMTTQLREINKNLAHKEPAPF